MIKSYFLPTKFKRYCLAVGLITSVLFFGTLIYITRNLPICFSIYFVLLAIYANFRTIHWLTIESVQISEQEIIYITDGITVKASWADVEQIKRVFVYGLGLKQDCLIIDQSQIKVISASLFGHLLAPRTMAWNLQKTIIPLSHFSKTWRDSELGQQIKQYAPHLFVDKQLETT